MTEAKPTIVPSEIRRRKDETGAGTGIEVAWSDGSDMFLPSDTLRLNCPCASCQEKRGALQHEKPLSPPKNRLQVLRSTREEETNLLELWPVGNYALGMRWGDRHDSGIYSFEFLHALSNPKP